MKSIPPYLQAQTTSPPPNKIGCNFAADVMKRHGQLILVLRESVSSYTRTCLVDSERHQDLRNGLLYLCADTVCIGDGGATIRTDPAPGFTALVNDQTLSKHGIKLEIGNPKNSNKNPVAERAIEELGIECLHFNPEGGPVTKVSLALITSMLNSRIRREGLSAREIWTQRDQLTGSQIPLDDRDVILNQHRSRRHNHDPSSRSKSKGHDFCPNKDFEVGNLVYLVLDGDKTKARDKYIITEVNDNMCNVRKFTRDQFRSKTYTVKLSDCYPIAVNVPSPGGPVRGLDNSDNIDSDNPASYVYPSPTEPHMFSNMPSHIPTHEPAVPEQTADRDKELPPDDITRPPDPAADTSTVDESRVNPCLPSLSQGTRASQRQKKVPAWMDEKTWDMS